MIVKELLEIKSIIGEKKRKFQVSLSNLEELNEVFNRKKKSNLLMELKAQEILSDMMFLETVEKSFYEEIRTLVMTINEDFKTKLNVINFNLSNFTVIKEKVEKYFVELNIYYDNKFEKINSIMKKQDTDIDDVTSDFMVLMDTVKSKINNNQETFQKIEKKYENILIYVKKKISD